MPKLQLMENMLILKDARVQLPSQMKRDLLERAIADELQMPSLDVNKVLTILQPWRDEPLVKEGMETEEDDERDFDAMKPSVVDLDGSAEEKAMVLSDAFVRAIIIPQLGPESSSRELLNIARITGSKLSQVDDSLDDAFGPALMDISTVCNCTVALLDPKVKYTPGLCNAVRAATTLSVNGQGVLAKVAAAIRSSPFYSDLLTEFFNFPAAALEHADRLAQAMQLATAPSNPVL